MRKTFQLTNYLRENQTIHNLGLLLLFETGMRVGEMCVLKAENITKDGIIINSTEIYYKDPETKKTVFEVKNTPKMGADERTIIIPEHTRTIIKRIRLERSTHKIRKTYASKLIDADVEEAIIRAQMGHTDIKTTKDYYYYSTQDQKYKESQISKAISV